MSVSVVAGPRFEPTHISRPASKLDRPAAASRATPSTPERDFELAVGVDYFRY